MNHARHRVEELLIPVTQLLLKAEGGHCERRQVIKPGGAIRATIGFAGADMHGALALLALEPTVRRLVTNVLEAESESDALLCDMVVS